MNDTAPDERSDARRPHLRLLALAWLASSVVWAGVIIVTDALAWPLALWIATTLGPLALLRDRIDPHSGGRS